MSKEKKSVGKKKRPVDEKCLLWKIQDPNTNKVSYMFGTMHVLPQNIFDRFFNAIKKTGIINNSNIVLTEIGDIFAEYFIPDKKDIKKFRENIKSKKNKISKSIDFRIAELAKKLNKAVIPLESRESATKHLLLSYAKTAVKWLQKKSNIIKLILFGLTFPISAPMLYIAYRILKKIGTRQLEKDYKNQDMASIINNEISESNFELLVLRNKEWLQKGYDGKITKELNDFKNMDLSLLSLLKENNLFIAVGAAHLFGKFGLINALKTVGYKVTPVKGWLNNPEQIAAEIASNNNENKVKKKDKPDVINKNKSNVISIMFDEKQKIKSIKPKENDKKDMTNHQSNKKLKP